MLCAAGGGGTIVIGAVFDFCCGTKGDGKSAGNLINGIKY